MNDNAFESVKTNVINAWKNWNPHFELLTSGSGETMIAFFMFDDTDVEWRLYQSMPEELAKEFAARMESAKETLLAAVGFGMRYEETKATEQEAENMSEGLSCFIKQYERKTGAVLSRITFNTLFDPKWSEISEMECRN